MVISSFGQDTITPKKAFPKNISISYGIGAFAMKDYFFSEQKYTGSMPYFSMEWMQPHDRYGYRMGFGFRKANDIKNYTMPATITQFSFYQDFLYSLGKFRLFKKDVYTYLGPSFDFYFFNNQQQFTDNAFYFEFSFLGMLSAAADVYFNLPLSRKWQLESNLRLNILSIAIQMPEVVVDEGKDAGATIKLLTPFKGLKTSFDLGGRFFIIKRLSVSLAYRMELTNVTVRKRVVTVSDNVVGTLAFHF